MTLHHDARGAPLGNNGAPRIRIDGLGGHNGANIGSALELDQPTAEKPKTPRPTKLEMLELRQAVRAAFRRVRLKDLRSDLHRVVQQACAAQGICASSSHRLERGHARPGSRRSPLWPSLIGLGRQMGSTPNRRCSASGTAPSAPPRSVARHDPQSGRGGLSGFGGHLPRGRVPDGPRWLKLRNAIRKFRDGAAAP
jgi:hypothetical protein